MNPFALVYVYMYMKNITK